MNYEIVTSNAARKQLLELPKKIQARIEAAIDGLAADPRPHGSLKLEGEDDLYVFAWATTGSSMALRIAGCLC